MSGNDAGFGTPAQGGSLRGFHDLMRLRVETIVLVSSLYDSFILAEDGQLNELILSEFLHLNLRHTPGLIRVSSGAEALELARDTARCNLIITSMHVGDMDAATLARRLKEAGIATPVVALAYDNRELAEFQKSPAATEVDRVFLWQGDVRILLAIVKYVEDRMNVAHDTGALGVQAIIVVEDNVKFYSSFLPIIYTEVMHHAQTLVPEGVNLSHKLLRIQARPKILLASSFEEAWGYFEAYRENVLGVVSDIEFPLGGRLTPGAGFELARRVREQQPDVPILLQSSFQANEAPALAVGASFLLKNSPTLLSQLRQFMVEHFSFGDFVFRLPDGTEVARAADLKALEATLHTVPPESLGYHGEHNHFSNWLKARTEFALAHRLRPRKVSDFASLEDLRRDMIRSIQEYRDERRRGVVTDFDPATFDAAESFSRIGGGSLGGKARGLAFVNHLLHAFGVRDRFPGVRVAVPPAVVLGADVFDRFVERDGLRDFAIHARDDGEILERFRAAPFPDPIRAQLAAYLELARYPLAVRSSSLLEDSQYQPFAGIYDTYMLPNTHADLEVRLAQLLDAVRRVYASTFSRHAKAYLETTPYRLEEEKMAVILQRVVGRAHGDRFYPDFAGVARSHNFYPTPPMRTDDGIAAVALGLGRSVVDGEACVRFCPRYPRHLIQFSSVQGILRSSQRHFYAVRLGDAGSPLPEIELTRLGLEAAEEDGTLALVASTYSPENDAVYDGMGRPGVRLVSFAPVLKHGSFPLPEILSLLLDIGTRGTGTPVEIEFAARPGDGPGGASEFGFLQLRPLALSRELAELKIDDADPERIVCASPCVLGHGRIDDLRDVVVVDGRRFDRMRSPEVAQILSRFNAQLVAAARPYVLFGVGRWGSADPLLGIPVTWDQIAGARVIVEAGFDDVRVTPSQGTHFFQNLASSNVGYFTVNEEQDEGFVDWAWLAAQPAAAEAGCVRHLRLDEPLVVKMNGRESRGVVLRGRPAS